ncbi:MAG TPA: VWA domain-containing protein [Parafilimonas sp.]|nr:VWA domain-containing protein [Parafilimonas sp.]
MKLYMYCMAIFAMMLFAVACENTSSSSNDMAMVQDVQLEAIQSPQQLSNETESTKKTDSANDKAGAFNTEDYDHIIENKFLSVMQQPLSTFSIDVDRAAYSNVRRFIEGGSLPPKGAVRIEEMINYFDYNYQPPTNDKPFAVYTEIASCPWNTKHKLVQIGLQGRKISTDNLPESNLVFLIDVSGSMDEPNKLPLVQQALSLLTDQLREDDNVAIVVYAGSAGLVLPSTPGSEKRKIKEAIDALRAGGSTAGGEGIKLAYKIAEENKKPHGNNRVVLATDGDFNVGASSDDELVDLIEKERQSGISLSVLGFGMGNYKDNKMQQLADKGNGNHNYIDNLNEARKVLVNEFGGTIFTIAKDVKLQIEFNPSLVNAYRLIGYENRMLANEDFNDDKKDAGELGAGHTVTALYEIIPAGINDTCIGKVDDLKYQQKKEISYNGNELMNIKLRYKQPESETSKLITYPVADMNKTWEQASGNFKLSAAVAEFGLLLRGSSYKQNSSFEQVLKIAKDAAQYDAHGYRSEFVKLIKEAQSLENNN